MFTFENVKLSRDAAELSASCRLAVNQAFFAGHFPAAPIMPAVAQLQMIETLLRTRSDWPAGVRGGSGIKFLRRVEPGSELRIRLTRKAPGTIGFELEQDDAVVAKGTLQVTGNGSG